MLDEKLFEKPLEFNSKRFLNNKYVLNNGIKDYYSIIAFGGGNLIFLFFRFSYVSW
jgi:cytochrome P450